MENTPEALSITCAVLYKSNKWSSLLHTTNYFIFLCFWIFFRMPIRNLSIFARLGKNPCSVLYREGKTYFICLSSLCYTLPGLSIFLNNSKTGMSLWFTSTVASRKYHFNLFSTDFSITNLGSHLFLRSSSFLTFFKTIIYCKIGKGQPMTLLIKKMLPVHYADNAAGAM